MQILSPIQLALHLWRGHHVFNLIKLARFIGFHTHRKFLLIRIFQLLALRRHLSYSCHSAVSSHLVLTINFLDLSVSFITVDLEGLTLTIASNVRKNLYLPIISTFIHILCLKLNILHHI